MDFFAEVLLLTKSGVEMSSFCLLTAMELTLAPNCSSLHLLSNDMNSLKSFQKNYSYTYDGYKNYK